MKNDKYELTDEKWLWSGHELYRIRACKDMCNEKGFAFVNEGDLGGFIESERNLGISDASWVRFNAKVYGNAVVKENATITDNVEVYGNAVIKGNSTIYGKCQVSGDCTVESTLMNGCARVSGTAKVTNSSLGGMINVGSNAVIRNSRLIEYGLDVFIGENACIQSYRDIIEMAGVGKGGAAIVAYRVMTADMVVVAYDKYRCGFKKFKKRFKGKDPDMDNFINMVQRKLYL